MRYVPVVSRVVAILPAANSNTRAVPLGAITTRHGGTYSTS
nr:hypothetical protein [Steroidobacter gossypii]